MSYGLSALLCIFIRNFLHITIIKIYDTEGIALARKIVCFFAPQRYGYIRVSESEREARVHHRPGAQEFSQPAALALSLDVEISFR